LTRALAFRWMRRWKSSPRCATTRRALGPPSTSHGDDRAVRERGFATRVRREGKTENGARWRRACARRISLRAPPLRSGGSEGNRTPPADLRPENYFV
jgi:hypothetical protein